MERKDYWVLLAQGDQVQAGSEEIVSYGNSRGKKSLVSKREKEKLTTSRESSERKEKRKPS